ncbi:MAG: hypothetical protein L6R42_004477 [Xanthoria sp. 1 TBL-2021]|nr:MAG: hypothetical protein L6R42_004477 [Xanthoria sp. 1 TBL-2021]
MNMDYKDMASDEKHGLHPHPLPQRAPPSTSHNSPLMNRAHNSLPPAPDYNTPRTLHIYLDGLTQRHMTIADADKTHPLYTIDQNSGGILSSTPHMTISQPQSPNNPTPAVIGTATFHNMKRTIELEFQGQLVSMDSEGIFSRSYAFMSPAFGQRLWWECDGIWGADLVLVNARKEWIAKFDSSLFSWSKLGKLHISNGAISGATLDEIVVSGCAFMQHERRRRNRSSAGGGAASGGAY